MFKLVLICSSTFLKLLSFDICVFPNNFCEGTCTNMTVANHFLQQPKRWSPPPKWFVFDHNFGNKDYTLTPARLVLLGSVEKALQPMRVTKQEQNHCDCHFATFLVWTFRRKVYGNRCGIFLFWGKPILFPFSDGFFFVLALYFLHIKVVGKLY